jgi:hypothetical protein
MTDRKPVTHKLTLRCNYTGKEFAVWLSNVDEATEVASELRGAIVSIVPSDESELMIAQIIALWGGGRDRY